jgi:hypothetical protein
MMRMFDSEGLRTASGDVFGRIYDYFLALVLTIGSLLKRAAGRRLPCPVFGQRI